MKFSKWKCSFGRHCTFGIGVMYLSAVMVLAACNNSTGTQESELEIVDIEVTPDNHVIVKGGNKKFTALGVTSTGEKIPFEDLDREKWGWEWFTSDSRIATFESSGLATGHEVGNTICWIVLFNSSDVTSEASFNKEAVLSATNHIERPKLQRLNFTGRDSFGVQVVTPDKIVGNIKR